MLKTVPGKYKSPALSQDHEADTDSKLFNWGQFCPIIDDLGQTLCLAPDGTAGPNQLCLGLDPGTNPEGICHRGEIKVAEI